MTSASGRFNPKSKRLRPLPLARFEHRDFSDRTIQALVACAIDSPERLLFLREETLMDIPGVGAAALSEISKYRAKFSR
jgi:DNA-directed RNA polymerase alpha subunit